MKSGCPIHFAASPRNGWENKSPPPKYPPDPCSLNPDPCSPVSFIAQTPSIRRRTVGHREEVPNDRRNRSRESPILFRRIHGRDHYRRGFGHRRHDLELHAEHQTGGAATGLADSTAQNAKLAAALQDTDARLNVATDELKTSLGSPRTSSIRARRSCRSARSAVSRPQHAWQPRSSRQPDR